MRSICFYCRSCAKNYDYAYFHKSPTSPAAKKKEKTVGLYKHAIKIKWPGLDFTFQHSEISDNTQRERGRGRVKVR